MKRREELQLFTCTEQINTNINCVMTQSLTPPSVCLAIGILYYASKDQFEPQSSCLSW